MATSRSTLRLRILGGLGPYPGWVSAFVEAEHQIRYVCTEDWCPRKQLPRGTALTVRQLGSALEGAVERLARLIECERGEAVYALLNVWDGSNRATAALLRGGCPVPVIRHYEEHDLAIPARDFEHVRAPALIRAVAADPLRVVACPESAVHQRRMTDRFGARR